MKAKHVRLQNVISLVWSPLKQWLCVCVVNRSQR